MWEKIYVYSNNFFVYRQPHSGFYHKLEVSIFVQGRDIPSCQGDQRCNQAIKRWNDVNNLKA